MAAWYNEHDPFAAAWLRELIKAGLIADGEVDERDIRDVRADDLRGFHQCHFFAGIGGWSYALRLAGWPDDRPVWTGSCPCQPFSCAGKGDSASDPRHLWPTWAQLIAQCLPPVVFGEQVSSADGRAWLDVVCDDLEASDYAIGAIDTPAGCVGAPHIRQRLYFVADSKGAALERWKKSRNSFGGSAAQQPRTGASVGRCGSVGALAHAGFWRDVEWIPCADGKARPVEPGLKPLVDGLPGRLDLLRGFGNAIVPENGSAFISAYCEARGL